MSIMSSSDHLIGHTNVAAVDAEERCRTTDTLDNILKNSRVEVKATPSGALGGKSDPGSELCDALSTFQVAQGYQDTRGDEITNQQGAPTLSDASIKIGSIDPVIRVALLSAQSGNAQKLMVTETIRSTTIKLQKNTEFRLENQREIDKKAVESSESKHKNKIFSWIGKVVAVVVAVAAVAVSAAASIASGGAGLPLLAISTMALVAATVSLADQISQECNGPPLSLSLLVSNAAKNMLQAFGVDEDKASKIAMVLSGAAAVLCPVMLLLEPQMLGPVAQSICALAGVDPETAQLVGLVVGLASAVVVGVVMAVATTLASGGAAALPAALKLINGIAQAGGQIVQGGLAIAQGVTGYSTAKIEKVVSYLHASNIEISAISKTLKNQMASDQETIKDLLQKIQDSIDAATQIIVGFFETQSQISRNIGQGRSV